MALIKCLLSIIIKTDNEYDAMKVLIQYLFFVMCLITAKKSQNPD